jgi:hypothetical protein
MFSRDLNTCYPALKFNMAETMPSENFSLISSAPDYRYMINVDTKTGFA